MPLLEPALFKAIQAEISWPFGLFFKMYLSDGWKCYTEGVVGTQTPKMKYQSLFYHRPTCILKTISIVVPPSLLR